MRSNSYRFLSISIIAGFVSLGYFINEAKKSEGTLVVKGLSEKKITATDVIWNLSGVYQGTIGTLNHKVSNHITKVKEFLQEKGFSDKEIRLGEISYDLDYGKVGVYNATVSVEVSTKKVDLVSEAYSQLHELIKRGVAISGGKWSTSPRYYVENFQSVKSELLEDSFKAAKQSAENIVNSIDSDVSLGRVLFVNQGILEVQPLNGTLDDHVFYKEKLFRLVSTVKYSID